MRIGRFEFHSLYQQIFCLRQAVSFYTVYRLFRKFTIGLSGNRQRREKEEGKKEDALPLWVADMDFKTVPAVTKRLQKAVEHGIYGYSDSKEDYFAAVSGWYRDHFDWNTKQEWMIKTPGVVFALAAAVRAYTEKGDAVLSIPSGDGIK